MGGGSLKSVGIKYICVLLSLLMLGCQSSISNIGKKHAKEIIKWQELARYAGNELAYLGFTVTTGVQIIQNGPQITYKIVKVQLNRSADHTEVDLLSPKLETKFACGTECKKLSLYNAKFATPETQLTHFFLSNEGAFFEFYGRLVQLNHKLAHYRASSPDILDKYLSWMLNQDRVYNSLSEFLDNFERDLSQDKLLAFAQSGFRSPLLQQKNVDINNEGNGHSESKEIAEVTSESSRWSTSEQEIIKPNAAWKDEAIQSNAVWQTEGDKPNDDWDLEELVLVSSVQTPDKLLIDSLLANDKRALADSLTKQTSWQLAKQNQLNVGSIACTYSDNSFGFVKSFAKKQVTLAVKGQASVIVDGMKHSPQAGHLFNDQSALYFVKTSREVSYPLSDVAPCYIEHLAHQLKAQRPSEQ